MPVKRAGAYLGVSRSGYYKFLHHTPSSLEIENTTLAELIQTIFYPQREIWCEEDTDSLEKRICPDCKSEKSRTLTL